MLERGLGHPLGAAARTHGREEEAWLQAPIPEIKLGNQVGGGKDGLQMAQKHRPGQVGCRGATSPHRSSQQPICP